MCGPFSLYSIPVPLFLPSSTLPTPPHARIGLGLGGAQKFVARKARKFKQQGGRLALPALEFAYFFLGITHAPRSVITSRMLPLVEEQLGAVLKHAANPRAYASGQGAGEDEYWDDLALARFLKGICLRYAAYPDPDAVLEDAELRAVEEGREEAGRGAKECFEAVFRDGPKVVYDHYLVYFARECCR